MATPSDFDALEREIADSLFDFQPTYGVDLGRHEYDGRLPDYSVESTERWASRADSLLHRLDAIDSVVLPADRRVDRFLLRLLLEGSLFDLRDARRLERNPMTYLGIVSATPYLVREYLPAADRARSVVAVLRGVSALTDQGRRRLRGPLPKPFVETALAIAGGLGGHFAEAEAFCAGAGLAAEATEARAAAVAAVAGFSDWLRTEELPRADADFALGAAGFQRLLFVREGVEAPFADLERAGRRDLARNRARLDAIAHDEHVPVSALIVRLHRDRPTAEGLLDTARGYVEECRRLVESKELASIPGPVDCRVAETPVWARTMSTASMDSPGPFEAGSTQGVYYVTLVDPAWGEEQREEWLRMMNRPMLRNTAVHEVYPGHYLQALHFRATAGSLARKVYRSPAFVEGWAHYCEQLAIEAGIGPSGVDAEVVQLLDALLRDCRLLAAIGMHTAGWTVEMATDLFEREAFLERLPAQREALRGTFDPEYYCYTLGKLAIVDARHRHLSDRFGGRLRDFHDALLRSGCPPVGLLDGLLGADATASTAAPA